MEHTTITKNIFPVTLGVIVFLAFYLILNGMSAGETHNIPLITATFMGILAGGVAAIEKA